MTCGAFEARVAQAPPQAPAASEVSAGSESSAGSELPAGEMSAGEMSAGEMSAGEMSAGEMSAGEMSAGEMSAGQKLPGICSSSQQGTPQPPQDQSPQEALLDELSPHFEVRATKYGGRGCFARADIEPGTVLLRAARPVASAVVRPFRKEVCTWCFRYKDGKTLKFRLHGKVYFCSQECLDSFAEYDPQAVLSDSLCALETLYLQCEGEEDVPDEPADLDQEWAQVAAWEKEAFAAKPARRRAFHPTVTKDEYAESRYVLGALYTQYHAARCSARCSAQCTARCSDCFEQRLFSLLQSAELDKVRRYPYLGRSYISIYKLVRLACRRELLAHVNPTNVRAIIGRNLTNAFGIWSPTTQPGEEREFFGFGVYPSGSFFNHSCAPNVDKTRTGAAYEFRTCAGVARGDELCISYGVSDERLDERRSILSEWFFCCCCSRCLHEASGEPPCSQGT